VKGIFNIMVGIPSQNSKVSYQFLFAYLWFKFHADHVLDAVGSFHRAIVKNMRSMSLFSSDNGQFMENGHGELAISIINSDFMKSYTASTRDSVRQQLDAYVKDKGSFDIKAGIEVTPIDHILMNMESSDQGEITSDQIGKILRDEIDIQNNDLLQNYFVEITGKLSRHDARSIFDIYSGYMVMKNPQSFQHPLVSFVMHFLEKSGNGLIQKSELKEALRQLNNEKTTGIS
jgi:hypothetical protein